MTKAKHTSNPHKPFIVGCILVAVILGVIAGSVLWTILPPGEPSIDDIRSRMESSATEHHYRESFLSQDVNMKGVTFCTGVIHSCNGTDKCTGENAISEKIGLYIMAFTCDNKDSVQAKAAELSQFLPAQDYQFLYYTDNYVLAAYSDTIHQTTARQMVTDLGFNPDESMSLVHTGR